MHHRNKVSRTCVLKKGAKEWVEATRTEDAGSEPWQSHRHLQRKIKKKKKTPDKAFAPWFPQQSCGRSVWPWADDKGALQRGIQEVQSAHVLLSPPFWHPWDQALVGLPKLFKEQQA